MLLSNYDYLLAELLDDCHELNKNGDDFIYVIRDWDKLYKPIIGYSFDPIKGINVDPKLSIKLVIWELKAMNTHRPSISGALRHSIWRLEKKQLEIKRKIKNIDKGKAR